jgi:hypothetical protein
MASSQCHTIVVKEQSVSFNHCNRKLVWSASLHVDLPEINKIITIEDPLALQDHLQYRQHLGENLVDELYQDEIGASFSSEIDQHGQSLLGELKLGDTKFDRPTINVRVHGRPGATSEQNTIYKLHWEQLEREEVWSEHYIGPPDTLRVTVRRVESDEDEIRDDASDDIGSGDPGPKASANVIGDVESGQVVHTTEATINILLVVARKLPTTPDKEYDDVEAWPVVEAICDVKRKYRGQGIRQLHFELCRPGTFEALTTYLDMSSRNGHRFHIVHFDVHGSVDPETRLVAVDGIITCGFITNSEMSIVPLHYGSITIDPSIFLPTQTLLQTLIAFSNHELQRMLLFSYENTTYAVQS